MSLPSADAPHYRVFAAPRRLKSVKGNTPDREEYAIMVTQEQPALFVPQRLASDTTAVSFEGLTKHFGDLCAVNHLSLDIGQDETVALLGPNGAGKTTTISMLLGLLTPDSGSVVIQGMTPQAAIQSGRIGAMLQEGGLMPGVSVGELLDFVLALRASPAPRNQLLATAGLDGLERRRVDRLSGGQTQRLRFALAIASEPEILVLDEPTAAMDVEARHSFWANMRAYTAAGRTVLFATHYLEEAEAFASRVVFIAHGQIVADGTVADLKRNAGAQTVRFHAERSASESLNRLPGVARVEWQGENVTLTTSDSDATVRALAASEIAWQNLEVHGVDLDDVFMALVSTGE
jgi:ABC-2 type transport system ATP-binding protein